MEGVLEIQRRTHEEIDRLEQATVDVLLDPAPSQKGRLAQELTASALLDQISRTAQQLTSLYTDADLERQRQLDAITLKSTAGAEGMDFGDFYTHLKVIKDVHRRYPTDRPIDDSEFQAMLSSCRVTEEALESMFSGEEMNGRYLDLLLCYERYINLKNVRRLDYLQYLGEFDNFNAIPSSTKLSHAYARYLEGLCSYFERYFTLAKPLFNLASVKDGCLAEFEEQWSACKIAGWEEAAQREKESCNQGIFCGPCQKLFTNSSVYQAHLAGKKHLKAVAENPDGSGDAKAQSSANESSTPKMSTAKSLALQETLISKYSEILGQVREETRINVERKQSRTLDEREEDVLVEDAGADEDSRAEEEEAEGAIYNPKNLPLDWDGKPIPYWLWKLHGLGVRYPCEICGNHVYMGRKAFDQHFFEWRHSNGMKALGIPNTKHFFQITKISEAQTLWDKLKQVTRTESFRPEAMEEFEDHLGNVYNRKTYEDLRRQGLI